MDHFTVLGAGGFVGSHLTNYFKNQQIKYNAPERGDVSIFSEHLGHVIYCIGLTADFRDRPLDTVEAHVCFLKKIISECKFDSFLYLSSTRVYSGQENTSENSKLAVSPLDPSDLYNISKLMGESLCFANPSSKVRVARLSNVVGSDLISTSFIYEIIKESVEKNHILLKTTMESEKDYIHIQDVVQLLHNIALHGSHRIYNVASGKNTSNERIVNKIREITGCSLEIAYDATTRIDSRIDIRRIQNEFLYSPTSIDETIEKVTNRYLSNTRRFV